MRRLLLRRLPADEAAEVREHVDEDGQLTERYALMCGLSAGIATLGLLQSSSAVVIGAMLVSPLMGPIAKLGFAFASVDVRRAQEAARVVLIGSLAGVAIGAMLTWLSPIRNATPEIIARTAPTLLDLAVAVLSGIAGGYATVHRRGETAIGVAIATALMPPLATLGYSLAVARFDFALGAGLLFLTNLAAIAFSFALVARLRGVVHPIANIEFRRRYVILGAVAFLSLATPLALTLRRVTQETIAGQMARREVAQLLSIDPNQIAQLNVAWPNLEPLRVSATAITPAYVDNAESELRSHLIERFHARVEVSLQQIVASSPQAQSRAIVDAALSAQGIDARTVEAPLQSVRTATRAQVSQAWADRSAREITLLATPGSAWTLRDYQREEERLSAMNFGWTIKIVPPYQERIPILFGDDVVSLSVAQAANIDVAAWALQRWGVSNVVVEGYSGRATGASRNSRVLATARAQAVEAALAPHGITARTRVGTIQTARVLAEDGASRVRSADILAFSRP
ncbi:MAG: DUF389 domain-containing protein [Hyphomonadaceae bacterium]|nr:DUF389 domain-containing protein [Hyphomonadaceae bacterium]